MPYKFNVNNVRLTDEWPLEAEYQRRNVTIYVACAGLLYLCGPLVYVGVLQASLCNALGASDTISNLPSTAFYCSFVAPLFFAWRFNSVASIKPVVVGSYLLSAVAGLLVAASLYICRNTWLQIAAIVLYGALVGGATSVVTTFLWEIISRGVEPSRRGWALGLAFGFGPLMAVTGSVIAQLVITGEVGLSPILDGYVVKLECLSPKLEFPLNFATLFAGSVPLLSLAALLATQYVVPRPTAENVQRPPFLSGMALTTKSVFGDRALFFAMVAYVLVAAGSSVVTVMALYTPDAIGRSAADFAGYQNGIRFLFKMAAGLFLGWLVVRTSSKTGVLFTIICSLSGVLWVLIMPTRWFLVCFGLMGAGDLYGVYFPNYVMNRSSPDRVCQNIAYLQFLSLPISVAPALFGAISDLSERRTSFLLAAAILTLALSIATLTLPSHPELSHSRR